EDCDPADFTLWTVPKRFEAAGDPHAAIDAKSGSLEPLLELSARHEAEGQGDAPWPPHYRKAAGEPKRAAPSKANRTAGRAPRKAARESAPLIEIARADREEEAVAAAEAWKTAHAKAAAHLEPADVLVDRMRGSSSLWYRVRINLTRVPPRLRPKASRASKASKASKSPKDSKAAKAPKAPKAAK